MINEKTINQGGAESIDFTKLWMTVRNNWIWLLLIFLIVNGGAMVYLRYTKSVYESASLLKLEVKDEASELGIKGIVEDQNINLLSGEIELIQSNLFLSQVLLSAPIDVSYFATGRVLNEELFRNAPFYIRYKLHDRTLFNVPVSFEEKSRTEFVIRVPGGSEFRGRYNDTLHLPEADLFISRNNTFESGDEVGYYFIINSSESLLRYLSRNLTVEPVNYNANTIRLAFRDHNPFKAQAVLNKIDTLYLQYSYEQKNLANRQKIGWLTDQLSQIEKKMEGYEDYFENFTLENKSNNLDEDLRSTVRRITEIDSQRYQLGTRINGLGLLRDNLAEQNYARGAAGSQYLPAELNRSLEELQKLYLQQERLRLSYREVTFAYREQQKMIDALREKIMMQLGSLREDAIRRMSSLTQEKNRLEKEFASLPDRNTEFSKNLRFYKLNEQLYLNLMQSKAQFEVVQAGSVPDFRILSPASTPEAPISPKRLMIAGAGLVSSLVLIVFLTGLLYLFNNKVTSIQELEQTLSIPLLGVVPASRQIKTSPLFITQYPKSMVSEALRTVRTNLDFFNHESQRKVIAISSTVSGEGKSFLALNLGAIIAMSGKKVILVDLDLRKNKEISFPSGADPSRGISTVLIRRNELQECIAETPLNNLHYLPAGPQPPNPAELLLTKEFTLVLEKLRSTYDFVLIDTPPVGLVSDGIIAMKHADLNLYVFRANYSKRSFMVNLQRIIHLNKFTNLTMVLNALPSSGEHRYGYGYYEEAEKTSSWKKLINA